MPPVKAAGDIANGRVLSAGPWLSGRGQVRSAFRRRSVEVWGDAQRTSGVPVLPRALSERDVGGTVPW